MSKSYMPEVATLLGVELGEKFELTGMGDAKYKMHETGLILSDGDRQCSVPFVLNDVLCGKRNIVRRPWRPKKGQKYWSVYLHKDGSWRITDYDYDSFMTDINRILLSNCFPTHEAAEAAAPNIAQFYNDVRKMVEEE